jgi:hypothetical protein
VGGDEVRDSVYFLDRGPTRWAETPRLAVLRGAILHLARRKILTDADKDEWSVYARDGGGADPARPLTDEEKKELFPIGGPGWPNG